MKYAFITIWITDRYKILYLVPKAMLSTTLENTRENMLFSVADARELWRIVTSSENDEINFLNVE